MQAPARVRTPSLPPYLTRDRVKLATLEMAGTTALLLLYFLIRGIRPDDVSSSLDRGLQIVHLERQLGVFTEIHWQQAFLQYNWLIDIANQIYAWGHYVSLLPIGIWLALKDPPRFRFVRNVLLLSAVIGIVVYWTLPTAPPRLIDGLGFVDTVHGAASDGVVYFQPGPLREPLCGPAELPLRLDAALGDGDLGEHEQPRAARARGDDADRDVVGRDRHGQPLLLRHGLRRGRHRRLLADGVGARPQRRVGAHPGRDPRTAAPAPAGDRVGGVAARPEASYAVRLSGSAFPAAPALTAAKPAST